MVRTTTLVEWMARFSGGLERAEAGRGQTKGTAQPSSRQVSGEIAAAAAAAGDSSERDERERERWRAVWRQTASQKVRQTHFDRGAALTERSPIMHALQHVRQVPKKREKSGP